MSERAKKAAAVLYERGWSVGESDGKLCTRCGHDTVKSGRYCYNCGEPLHPAHSDNTLRDLEAAIAAAGSWRLTAEASGPRRWLWQSSTAVPRSAWAMSWAAG